MKFPIVLKKSPLVLIRRIVEVEFLVSVALFILSFLVNYEQLYAIAIGSRFRYDIFLVLAASIIQLVITIGVFLLWHGEEYRIKEKEILHKYGLFFSKEQSILLKIVQSVEYKRSPLEFLLGYGTIIIHSSNSEKPFQIKSVESAEIYVNLIKDAVDRALDRPTDSSKKLSIFDLILEGENSHLELKQTFRWDIKQKDTSKALEKATLKTISAFLNTDGGSLIIGVTDNGGIYGLEDDYKSLVRKDRDGFENHFNQVLKHTIGSEFRQYIEFSFETLEEKDVCLIEVRPSPKPVYLKTNGDEEFFIRTGNTTTPLSLSETNSYIDSHWKGKE